MSNQTALDPTLGAEEPLPGEARPCIETVYQALSDSGLSWRSARSRGPNTSATTNSPGKPLKKLFLKSGRARFPETRLRSAGGSVQAGASSGEPAYILNASRRLRGPSPRVLPTVRRLGARSATPSVPALKWRRGDIVRCGNPVANAAQARTGSRRPEPRKAVFRGQGPQRGYFPAALRSGARRFVGGTTDIANSRLRERPRSMFPNYD
jgi:hypothetical protein